MPRMRRREGRRTRNRRRRLALRRTAQNHRRTVRQATTDLTAVVECDGDADDAVTMSAGRASTFWLLYALAWAPLFAVNVFAWQLRGGLPPLVIMAGAAANVLPDACLGAALLRLRGRLWRRRPGPRQIAVLLAAAAGFATFAVACKIAANLILAHAEGSPLDWSRYDASILVWQVFLSLLAFAAVAGAAAGLVTLDDLRRETARRAQAELLRSRSELKALRAQLNPHFLFNALHSVHALIAENPRGAEEALIQLGDLLRHALRVQDAPEEGVLLADEWEFVRLYLSLEQLRLGDRLHIEIQASDEALTTEVPAFVLQPLVENAIVHGIAPGCHGGDITIRALVDGGDLRLLVDNSCDAEAAPALPRHEGPGRGITLVTNRLRALYGDAAHVSVTTTRGRHHVELRFPSVLEAS